MKINKAVILNRVEDAKHCIANNLHCDSILFSTHDSVDTYLRYEHNIECKCLSHFLEEEYIIKELKDSSSEADNIIEELDRQFSAEINKFYGFENIYFFKSLYSYTLRYQLAAFKTILRALDIVIEQYDLGYLSVYEMKDKAILKLPVNMKDMISLLKKKITVEIIYNGTIITGSPKYNYSRIVRSPHKVLSRIYDHISDFRFLFFRNGRKTIVLYEGLYDLSFLKKRLKNFNIVYCKEPEYFPVFLKTQTGDVKSFDFGAGFKKDFLAGLIKNTIIKCFADDIQGYISKVKLLDALHKKCNITLAISGTPPVFDVKSIIFEYLRSKDVPIVIGAHGFNYGLKDFFKYHINSDYNRCDYFISYGFTKKDLFNIYGEDAKSIKCEILPYGSKLVRQTPKANAKKRYEVDILFPITMNFSLFDKTLSRIKPELLTELQIRLLHYLDSKKNYSIIVKPSFFYNNYSGCSLLPVLRRLKNVRIIDYLSFSEALEEFDVKSVLIENINSALAEAMPKDVEIFTLGSSMDFFDQNALELIKKRVHYSSDVEELIRFLDLFLEKSLPSKRNNEFLERYLIKENTQESILNFINLLAKKR